MMDNQDNQDQCGKDIERGELSPKDEKRITDVSYRGAILKPINIGDNDIRHRQRHRVEPKKSRGQIDRAKAIHRR